MYPYEAMNSDEGMVPSDSGTNPMNPDEGMLMEEGQVYRTLSFTTQTDFIFASYDLIKHYISWKTSTTEMFCFGCFLTLIFSILLSFLPLLKQ
jgi:hypothetical protein